MTSILRLPAPLKLSLSAHLLVFGLALLLLTPLIPKTYFQPIEIEFVKIESTTDKALTQKQRTFIKRATKGEGRPAVTLDSLGLKYNLNTQPIGGTSLAMPSVNFARETKNLKLYDYIFKTIDGHLVYPSELIDQKVVGMVSARIWFSGSGNF